MKVMSVRFEDDTHEKLNKQSKKEKRSMNATIEIAVEEYLKKKDTQKLEKVKG